jgi:hypothetical protein
MPNNPWLIVGGWLSIGAGLLHLAVIAGGPAWYRSVGAGEAMAQMAERGELLPALITTAVAAMLFIWSAFAFSGAGLIRRLPLLRTGLCVIAAIYLLRGLVLLPLLILRPPAATSFDWWSSAIVLLFGLAYAIGTWTSWPSLAPIRAPARA